MASCPHNVDLYYLLKVEVLWGGIHSLLKDFDQIQSAETVKAKALKTLGYP